MFSIFSVFSVPVVQIGGGLVVMSTGWRLLQLDPEHESAIAKRKITTQDIANRLDREAA